MFDCEGKIAFITGGLGVIGRSYAEALFKNKLKGVALVDMVEPNAQLRTEMDAKYGQGRILYVKANITIKSELKSAFDKTIQHFGQLDIVINNAGIVNEEDYELCLKVNVMAVVDGTELALREYLPKYKKSTGMIINTASVAGVVPFAFPVYCLSKHAVVALGLCYKKSVQCAQHDIRILTICPGPTPSRVLDDLINTIPVEIREETRRMKDATGADYLGEGLVKMLKKGSHGAIWMFMEGREPYKMNYEPLHNEAMKYLMDQ